MMYWTGRLRFWGMLWGLCLFFFSPAFGGQAFPFSPGEEIQYDVKWQMYRAGQAVIRVLPFTENQGESAWHFELEARSNSFIDKLFKVRDRLEGFVAKDFSGSSGYAYTGLGKKKKQIRVNFTQNPNRAQYSNFEEIREPIEIPAHCFDPLSSFYKMRILPLEPGQVLSFAVTDGKKSFLQKGEVVARERLTLTSGTWDTLVVVPYVTHFSGVFTKSKDPRVRVWITDDERRIPVRIKVKVFFGSIYLDLNTYVRGRS